MANISWNSAESGLENQQGHPLSPGRRVPLLFKKSRRGSNVVDPDPDRSALIWLSWIRIRIGNADPEGWKLTKIIK
jgi:hypothetical protein